MGLLTTLPDGAYEYRYPAEVYGDDYVWSCVVVAHGDTAEIRLAPGAHPDRSDLARTLIEVGFTHAYWERQGGHKTRAFSLRSRKGGNR